MVIGGLKVKLLHLGDLLKRSATKIDKIFTETVIDEKDRAKKVRATLMIVPPKAKRMKLHYHTHREGWILVLSGQGKEIVDGKEYLIKENDLLFIPAKENHRIENTGNDELKVLEMYSLPHDFIIVEKRDKDDFIF